MTSCVKVGLYVLYAFSRCLNEFKGVRIEWCKSRARASRFTEEVALLVEEMHRVLRFFDWKVQDWLAKGELKSWPGMMSQMRAEGL